MAWSVISDPQSRARTEREILGHPPCQVRQSRNTAHPVRTVEPRPVILWVGDGQPNLTEGSENLAHETAVVRLSGKNKPLDACELK